MVSFGLETAWAQTQQETFEFTGAPQSFVVPPGVFSIHIQAWGAQGGQVSNGPVIAPGLGGYAQGLLAVTPGQVLEIFAGGQGCVQFNGTGCGGFNGGGNAFSNGNGQSNARAGGGGGGLEGNDGGPFQGGGGGTQTAGGAGAFEFCLSGTFGQGGSAAGTTCGGGGGGWYGGGSGCGGGGGSSYIGGVTEGTTLSNTRIGDGLVIFIFTPETRNIPALSQWGLVAMAGVLGIAGILVYRKRQLKA